MKWNNLCFYRIRPFTACLSCYLTVSGYFVKLYILALGCLPAKYATRGIKKFVHDLY